MNKLNRPANLREAEEHDLPRLLALYTQLHDNPMPENITELSALWGGIQQDKNHHIILAEADSKIVSSCVLIIVPNLTHGQSPYGFIENVITDAAYRGKGYATSCLDFAREIARGEGCYKLMLMTGSKKMETLNFYRRAGYNSDDKTAFIQWLEP